MFLRKKIPYILAIIAVSCGGAENATNETSDHHNAHRDSVDSSAVDQAAKSYTDSASVETWTTWAAEYNEGYDTFEGNAELDGKEVVLQGKIERIIDYARKGESPAVIVCFGEQEYGKCSISAIFPVEAKEALVEARNSGNITRFKGIVEEKRFDEIRIVNCSIVKSDL